jgi:predicted RNA-binding Zn ribbon-like protein
MAGAHVHHRPEGGAREGSLAVDFANSVACPSCRVADALSSSKEFERWVRARPNLPAGKFRPRDVEAMRRFRVDVRALLGASVDRTSPPAPSLGRVNSARRRALGRNDLMWHGGEWMVMERETSSPTSERIAGAVAQSVVELLAGPDRSKLRACRGPGCNHFLLARKPQQIWCSPTGCGNRVRVARHWRKVKALSTRRTASG